MRVKPSASWMPVHAVFGYATPVLVHEIHVTQGAVESVWLRLNQNDMPSDT
jgi:hypothetical protein